MIPQSQFAANQHTPATTYECNAQQGAPTTPKDNRLFPSRDRPHPSFWPTPASAIPAKAGIQCSQRPGGPPPLQVGEPMIRAPVRRAGLHPPPAAPRSSGSGLPRPAVSPGVIVTPFSHLQDPLNRHPTDMRLHPQTSTATHQPYFKTFVTTPEPTVRPPSRTANRSPSSIPIGLPNSTSIAMLSPGMHISAPPINFNDPVTSVVRK